MIHCTKSVFGLFVYCVYNFTLGAVLLVQLRGSLEAFNLFAAKLEDWAASITLLNVHEFLHLPSV